MLYRSEKEQITYMEKGNILFLRSYPNKLNYSTYNIQQFGMGKAFNEFGYNFDFYTYTDKDPSEKTIYSNDNGTKTICHEVKMKKVLNSGINKELLSMKFVEKYDLVICQEYYQLMSYYMCKKIL